MTCQARGMNSRPRSRRESRQQPSLALGLHECLHRRSAVRGHEVQQALPVRRDEGVEVDQPRDAARHPLGDAGDDHSGGAVADEDHVVQALEDQGVDDVVDVGSEVHARMREVRALTEPGQRRGVHLVARLPEKRGELAPTPAAQPCGMNQHERGHENSSRTLRTGFS